jgi:hypothetical protein
VNSRGGPVALRILGFGRWRIAHLLCAEALSLGLAG